MLRKEHLEDFFRVGLWKLHEACTSGRENENAGLSLNSEPRSEDGLCSKQHEVAMGARKG